MHTAESTLAAATHLLANRFGGTPELSQPEDLGGSGSALVLRCKVAPNPFLQERSVVIKHMPPHEDTPVGVDSADEAESTAEFLALMREVVAYQYTNTLSAHARPGPMMLAYDMQQRILILSDAGDGENFSDVLTLHPPAERLVAVRKLGRALGKMHTATYAGDRSYHTLMHRLCQKQGCKDRLITESDIDVGALILSGLELLGDNELTIDPVVREIAEEAAARQSRGELQSFTPFDLTPDNIMLTNSVVFLDYEWASFRDVTFDVACVIVGFPQDNTTPALTDREVAEFLAAWRSETAQVWPELRDDEIFYSVMISSLIGWAFVSLMMLYYGTLIMSAPASGTGQVTARPLNRLSEDQLEDLATTIDAIARFARNHHYPRFGEVEVFAEGLLSTLAQLGARPQLAVL